MKVIKYQMRKTDLRMRSGEQRMFQCEREYRPESDTKKNIIN